MTDLRFEIPKGTGASKCKGCESFIYWIKTRAGKNMPVNADGTSHFSTCRQADKFRSKPSVVIAPAKFYPLLDDLKEVLAEIEEKDFRGMEFIEGLLVAREEGHLHQITQAQFTLIEQLYEKYCA